MIRIPTAVYMAVTPIDLRLSFDRLAGIIRGQFEAEPRADALFVFHNRRRTHLKLLWHDGSGYVIIYKRIDRGTFRLPEVWPKGAHKVSLSSRELRLLLEGLDQAALRAARRTVADFETSRRI